MEDPHKKAPEQGGQATFKALSTTLAKQERENVQLQMILLDVLHHSQLMRAKRVHYSLDASHASGIAG